MSLGRRRAPRPTSRLVLLWAVAISCIATWRAADIIQAVAELAK